MYTWGIISRKTPKTEILPEDKTTLLQWSKSRTRSKQRVERTKMILLSETGKPLKQITKDLHTYPNKIIYWRQRYIKHGIKGLKDKSRAGRPTIYDETFRNNVLRLLSSSQPKGLAHWDRPTLAKELGVPVDAVWMILRGEGISLQR